MDMGDMLYRYFGTRELDEVAPAALPAGIERMQVDFGIETERGPRFALWTLLMVLGEAPDLDVAFAEEEDREAARKMMDLMIAAEPGGQ